MQRSDKLHRSAREYFSVFSTQQCALQQDSEQARRQTHIARSGKLRELDATSLDITHVATSVRPSLLAHLDRSGFATHAGTITHATAALHGQMAGAFFACIAS